MFWTRPLYYIFLYLARFLYPLGGLVEKTASLLLGWLNKIIVISIITRIRPSWLLEHSVRVKASSSRVWTNGLQSESEPNPSATVLDVRFPRWQVPGKFLESSSHGRRPCVFAHAVKVNWAKLKAWNGRPCSTLSWLLDLALWSEAIDFQTAWW